MVSISQKVNSRVKVRATEKSFAILKREHFPEVGGTASAWRVDPPIPTVRRHSLQCRQEERHIGRAVSSGQEDRE